MKTLMDLRTDDLPPHIVKGAKELFAFVTAGELRRSLLELYFHYQINKGLQDLPASKELNTHFYYLIDFLNEVDAGDETDLPGQSAEEREGDRHGDPD